MAILKPRYAAVAAGTLSLFTLVFLWRGHTAWLHPFLRTFGSILLDALPYLALGSLVSSVIETYVSDKTIARFAPKRRLVGLLFGSSLGLALPLCECGMVPIVRRLIRKGLPPYVGIAYLAAGPIVNPVVIVSTFAAFPDMPQLAYARFALAFAVAIALGLLLSLGMRGSPLREAGSGQRDRDRGHDHHHDHDHEHEHHDHGHLHNDHDHHHGASEGGFLAKLPHIGSHAVADLLDMSKYLFIGALLASIVQTAVRPETFALVAGRDLSAHLFMMAFAFLLSLCSTADAFVAASFVHLFRPGAILSFLVLGPMMDLKSLLLMLSVFRRRFVIPFALLTAWLVLLGSHIFERYGWI